MNRESLKLYNLTCFERVFASNRDNYQVASLLKASIRYRVASSARNDERGSSIAKDLINSEDPKHTLFCRETAFVAIYALFQG